MSYNKSGRLTVIFLVVTFIFHSLAADIIYQDFSDISGLSLNDDAAQVSGNILRLTPSVGWQNGSAWLSAQETITNGFKTTFTFRISELNGPLWGADGFAFVIHTNALSTIGADGGGMGYDGVTNAFAIEFDTFYNGGADDGLGKNHTGIHVGGPTTPVLQGNYRTATSNIPNMSDGDVHTVYIDYKPGDLKLYIDDMTTPVLTDNITIDNELALDNGKAWIGFTAATGADYENHDIESWSYFTGPIPFVIDTDPDEDSAEYIGSGPIT
ncbi:MAG TPA: L-type lectin-domain containing protein, partial [Spirochaetota bacterium]|nr:L-type lectin-domain containing protein [Spirochaetota bacterium]